MRIEVRQQGGFAGLRPPPRILDTSDLDRTTAGEIERLANALPAGNEQRRGADLMRYDVTVDDRTTTYHEPDVPPPVRKLLALARDAGRNA
jgi:emfourin